MFFVFFVAAVLRVVTDDCYPYQPPQQPPAEVGRCMMQSRSVGRGKRQATQRCPNTHNYQNDIYQSTPPYRLSSNVGARRNLNPLPIRFLCPLGLCSAAGEPVIRLTCLLLRSGPPGSILRMQDYS